MTQRILFIVRRQYYDAMLSGVKTWEARRASKRWLTMCYEPVPEIAVIMCGRLIHRRRIIGTDLYLSRDGFEREFLGRPCSEQERADIGDGAVVVFHLREMMP